MMRLGHLLAVCFLLLGAAEAGIAADPSSAASRFLEQASFGADPLSIARVQEIGFETWLEEQFAMPPTPIPDAPAGATNLAPAQQSFFYNAMTGPDQLRQRVAFALGEIWVISGVKIKTPDAFVPYLRILQHDAFANYYTLMYDVTLSPAMGHYLDMVNNDKPNPASGKGADENYAREVMQLFTIGLYELNDSGTPRLGSDGQPIPTYSQDTIEAFARVFTGWTYPPMQGNTSRVHNPAYWDGPMVAFNSNHDTDPKQLLGGVVLPKGRSAAQDLSDALHNIFNHHNVGPFIGKQLIQHLVTSNPSPAYVARVSAAFNDNGAGVRGDMQAVVRAILLDPEARQYEDVPAPGPRTDGHLREPVLFLTGLLRPLGAKVPEQNNLASYATTMGQPVYYAPSVFNSFTPSYEIPGTQLLGPEFQLLSPATSMVRVNFINKLYFGTIGGGTTLDLSQFEAAASNPSQLVDLVNTTLLHGAMSFQARQSILTAVAATPDNATRARTALYLAAVSGEYQVVH